MSLMNFRAQNHPQQETRDEVDDRAILPEYFEPLHAEFGFTIDAAASESNAVLPTFWTREDDALGQRWVSHRVWCNPPYSDLRPWVRKAWSEMNRGCALIVMLVPANRCEQGWWQEEVEPFRDGKSSLLSSRLTTRFLPTRWRFKWPASRVVPIKGDRPPFGCVLLIWEREK
ncbi:MAG: DNA N-6-adenine-methyltransferase [Methylocystis sp.]|uniref:DNA N-6-adenine-methyltransferase n=1 Tax=Methylocystis sp. TaxID=1911079 RepID=UPI003DA60626